MLQLEHIVALSKRLGVPCTAYEIDLEELRRTAQLRTRLETQGVVLENMELPDAFKCPVTLEIMKDPTVASDGHSYERSTLQRLLRTRSKSPMTRERLNKLIAVPNTNLRKRIREYTADVCDVLEKRSKHVESR